MASKPPPPRTIAHRVKHELAEYAVISAYLYVCFAAILLYKTAILSSEGINFTAYGTAAVKAIILGKFILLGQAAGIGDRYEKRSPIGVIAHKTLLFTVALFVLSAIEEMIAGIIHGRTVAASLAELGGGTFLQLCATCIIMLLILIPYLAFKELSDALGEGRLRQILFEVRVGRRAGSRRNPE